jgi:hypothetical protein
MKFARDLGFDDVDKTEILPITFNVDPKTGYKVFIAVTILVASYKFGFWFTTIRNILPSHFAGLGLSLSFRCCSYGLKYAAIGI